MKNQRMTPLLLVIVAVAAATAAPVAHAQTVPDTKLPANPVFPDQKSILQDREGARVANTTPAPAAIEFKPAPASSNVQLSPWASEIAKMVRAGISDDVLLSFIDNSGTFNLDADQIIRLKDLGVSSACINAMLQHDAGVISGARPLTITSALPPSNTLKIILASSAPASGQNNPQPAPQPAANPAPSPVAVFSQSIVAPGTGAASGKNGLADPFEITQPAAGSSAMEGFSAQNASLNYRVREPFPEQITAPIIVYRQPGIHPNTIVIQFGE